MSHPAPARVQVLVAGGGPAGSTAALLLARQGWDVLLVERQEEGRRKVCGEFVSAEGVAVLHRLGCLESLAAAGAVPIRRTRIHALSGETFAASLPERDGQCGLGVSRSLLDESLLTLAARSGVTVLRGAGIAHLSREGKDWSARLRTASGSRPVRASVMLGADGRNSLVARLAGTAGSFSESGIGWQIHLPRGSPPSDQVELFLLNAGYAGLAPVEADRWALGALLPRSRRSGGPLRHFMAELSVQPRLQELLRHPESILDRTAAFPVRMGMRWGTPDGLFLAGDAAGFVDPFSGQGISLALLGGEAACRASSLWLHGQFDAARSSYEEFLRRELAPRLVVAASLRRLLARSGWTNGLVRSLQRHPGLGRRVVGLTRNAGAGWLGWLPRLAGRLVAG